MKPHALIPAGIVLLIAAFPIHKAFAAQPVPHLGSISEVALEKARTDARAPMAGSPADWEDSAKMEAERQSWQNGRYPLGSDDDATHYARGSTLVIHMFVNHTGGTWTTADMQAAAAKATTAKDWYLSIAPSAANLHFDNEGGSGYWYYVASVPYDINNTSNDWSEDALASLGVEDADGDGYRVDDFSLALMRWDGGWDNVIVVNEAANVEGRAWASFVFARCFLYTDSNARVWCHEWGHIFGACDEYVENGHCGNGIDCGPCQGWYLSWVATNSNCDLPTCPQDVECVMDNNVEAFCDFTSAQWSWSDDNSDGILNNTKRRVIDNNFVWITEIPYGSYAYSTNTTDGYEISQRWNTWQAVGLRSPAGSDYNLRLYAEDNHNYLLASSSQSGANVDFIMSDYNHDRLGNEHLQVSLASGAANSYRLHWESGAQMLYPNGEVRTGTWSGPWVVRAWDVPLFGGETITFTLKILSGDMDLGMALFRSNGDYYHAGRSAALWQRDAGGAGQDESWTFNVPVDDVYGLVVWANGYYSGDYSIQVGPSVATLAEETPVYNGSSLGLYTYNPNAFSWAFVGARPDDGTDVTLRVFGDAYFQDEKATSAGQNGIEFVAADYTGGYSQDYARVARQSGSGGHRIEWEQDDDLLAGYYYGTWSAGHVGKMWDVPMNTDQTYFFREYHTSSSLDTGIYLFHSAGSDFYYPRNAAAASSNTHPPADGGEWFTYTAPSNDWYGFCQIVNDNSSGTYSLWFGPKYTTASDEEITSANEIVWMQGYPPARTWAAFGVRSSETGQASMWLYGDAAYSDGTRRASDLAVTGVAYVVADYNHNPLGWAYQRNRRTVGTDAIDCEWSCGNRPIQFVPGQDQILNLNWPARDVVEAYDLYVNGAVHGGQSVIVEVTDLSGSMNFGVALYASDGSTYYADPSSALVRANASGIGGTERITYRFTREDWYGLVVFNLNDAGGDYQIKIIDPATVDVAGVAPAALDLRATSANPFTDRATLQLSLPAAGDVDLSVFDVEGRAVRSLAQGFLAPGVRSFVWDGTDDRGAPVASGVYFARLQHRGDEIRVKLVRSQ